jgi:hypothetical protein
MPKTLADCGRSSGTELALSDGESSQIVAIWQFSDKNCGACDT